ncbi:MAG: hypothetical protein ABSB69_13585 [Solirubrobacteraceae bacterium]
MIRRVMLVLSIGALAVPLAVARAGGLRAYLYEWQPNGPQTGPLLVLQEKLDLTGKFGVQCGKGWIFSYFGGGEHPPITFDTATGTISGTESFPTNTVGIGSSFRAAEVDYYDIKSAGPVVMTLNAQASAAAAVGTLGLKLYGYTKAHGHGAHRVKAKKVLKASCEVPFDAPNYYAEAAAPTGESAPPSKG